MAFIRIINVLKRFRYYKYTIDDFCISMDCAEKQRKNFSNIKRCIIEPVMRELNKKDGWKIAWKFTKIGKKVTAVEFQFKKYPQGKLL
ncbi:replication initiation protein [Bartonella tribocorum]|uniref:replication initiation protein n=1 Tax=Bartonella tribocorum TaxID=85701 RepID=UPI00068DAE11